MVQTTERGTVVVALIEEVFGTKNVEWGAI